MSSKARTTARRGWPTSFLTSPAIYGVRRRLVAPHQPRLDWQMWFAALSNYRQNRWFVGFMLRVMQGEPAVLRLLSYNPFPKAPPKYIRAQLYSIPLHSLRANGVVDAGRSRVVFSGGRFEVSEGAVTSLRYGWSGVRSTMCREFRLSSPRARRCSRLITSDSVHRRARRRGFRLWFARLRQ